MVKENQDEEKVLLIEEAERTFGDIVAADAAEEES